MAVVDGDGAVVGGSRSGAPNADNDTKGKAGCAGGGPPGAELPHSDGSDALEGLTIDGGAVECNNAAADGVVAQILATGTDEHARARGADPMTIDPHNRGGREDSNDACSQLQHSSGAMHAGENSGTSPPTMPAAEATMPAAEGSSASIGNGGNCTTVSGSGTKLQLGTDAGDDNGVSSKEGEEGKESPVARARGVRFAPISTVKEFHSGRDVLSLGQEKECDVELHTGPKRQVKRRKRPRSGTNLGVNARERRQFSFADLYESSAGPETSVTPQSHQPDVKKKQIQVALLHSHAHTLILYHAMQYIHRDRDILLESLLKWCGLFQGAKRGGALSSFLTVMPPLVGTRKLLDVFHAKEYLDLIEFPPVGSIASQELKGSVEEAGGDGMEVDGDNESNDGCGGVEVSDNSSPGDSSTGTISSEAQPTDHEGDTGNDSFDEPPPSPSDEPQVPIPSNEVLSEYGLEDDCPFPTSHQAHAMLWMYCLAITGASWHAASLLTSNDPGNQTDVAIHWGGGRHHAHKNKAGGFCYISDVVLAILRLLGGHHSNIDRGMLEYEGHCSSRIQRNISFRRILYIDLDIHHADAVQAAFYETDRVMTTSFHRRAPGFFPASSGAASEKGKAGTSGLGYNLNVPLPAGISDVQFIQIYRQTLFGLVKAYDPQAIVLCVGADGLEGDELISGGLGGDSASGEGWSLSPEGLAECVRIAAAHCAGFGEDDVCCDPRKKTPPGATESKGDVAAEASSAEKAKEEEPTRGKRRKLLVLGGGGYTPAQTARTYLLCSAAACEGARPGMLWSDLPQDIPHHDHFPRYGPWFELVSEDKKTEILGSYASSDVAGSGGEEVSDYKTDDMSSSDRRALAEAKRSVELAVLYLTRQREKDEAPTFCFNAAKVKDDWASEPPRKKKSAKKGGGRRRKKTKTDDNDSQQKKDASSCNA